MMQRIEGHRISAVWGSRSEESRANILSDLKKWVIDIQKSSLLVCFICIRLNFVRDLDLPFWPTTWSKKLSLTHLFETLNLYSYQLYLINSF